MALLRMKLRSHDIEPLEGCTDLNSVIRRQRDTRHAGRLHVEAVSKIEAWIVRQLICGVAGLNDSSVIPAHVRHTDARAGWQLFAHARNDSKPGT